MHMTPEEAAFLALLDMLEKILPLLDGIYPMLNLQRAGVVRVVCVPAVLGVRVAEHPGGCAAGATVWIGAHTGCCGYGACTVGAAVEHRVLQLHRCMQVVACVDADVVQNDARRHNVRHSVQCDTEHFQATEASLQ